MKGCIGIKGVNTRSIEQRFRCLQGANRTCRINTKFISDPVFKTFIQRTQWTHNKGQLNCIISVFGEHVDQILKLVELIHRMFGKVMANSYTQRISLDWLEKEMEKVEYDNLQPVTIKN